jgi:hypothetical protein
MLFSPRKNIRDMWVDLPESKFGIEYALGGETKQWKQQQRLDPKDGVFNKIHRSIKIGAATVSRRRRAVLPRVSLLSPFETALDDLMRVIQRDGHPDGTAVVYIREILEPGDWEFDHISQHSYVCATQLSQEQVDRLRIMVLPKRREEILVTYLDEFRTALQNEEGCNDADGVHRPSEAFDSRYIAITDEKDKFDLLFGFTYALKKNTGWMFRLESPGRIEEIFSSLANHWRRLLGRYKPEELGYDREFSYPALLTFLEEFKRQAESNGKFYKYPIKFVYLEEENVKKVSFDDDTISCHTRSV